MRFSACLAATLAAALAACGWGVVRAQTAAPAAVAIFAGQSNEVSHGTLTSSYGFAGIPGGVGAAGVNAAANCYETSQPLAGASPGSGTLFCDAPSSGQIFAGQSITGAGVPAGQVVSAANNNNNFPSATGDGLAAGSYSVTPAATVGSAAGLIAMTFAEPDIGGSGNLNPNCQIWVPNAKTGKGSWQTYNPKVNSDYIPTVETPTFGPEGRFCQMWSHDNPGKTLYMIKLAVGGSSLCDQASGNDYSPEFAGSTGIGGFRLLQSQVAAAEAALKSQLNVGSYAVKVFQWGQGEQDNDIRTRPCGFPYPPFSAAVTPVPYLENLQDLIGRFAIPASITANFTGSISGTVLTVARMSSGSIHRYQRVSGPGVAPGTYIDAQISGVVGGRGAYSLKVYQATALGSIANASGAVCDRGSLSGTFFYAAPDAYTATAVTKSCVTGGVFSVGDSLSGTGVAPGTTITALDSAGHRADGLYRVNVNQVVASPTSPEAMSATVGGFGAGANTASFVLFRTFRNYNVPATGVQIAQVYVNDNAVTALKATTVNTNDALKATPTEIHYHAAWISELGRRLYLAYLGKCDYHAPTC